VEEAEGEKKWRFMKG